MADIFISYANEDIEIAIKLASALEAQGWSVWWDRKIIAGASFDQVIEYELETAKSIIVLWSENSISSEWVKNEAAVAVERGVLVPAMIDNVKLPLEFRRKQSADIVGWDGNLSNRGFKALCDGVSATANISNVVPRHPHKSLWDGFRWNRRWILSATIAIIVALGFAIYWGQRIEQQSESQISAKAIEGIWYADIQYSWGISEIERFDFTVDGNQLIGTASFGKRPRQIIDGILSKDRLNFRTNLETNLGDGIFQYRGEIVESQIQFTLDNKGEPPTKFVAARTVEEARRLRPRRPSGGTEPSLTSIDAGPYKLDHIRTKVNQLHIDIRQCYIATEFDPVDHVYVYYFLKIGRDGTVSETGAPGTDQRSVELDRCMDRVFRNVNWGATPNAMDAEIRLGFKALPAWRSQ